MLKFLGVIVFILLPLFLIALAVGRRLEDNEEKARNDEAIRDGLFALKDRVRNLERLRAARKERRG